MTGQADVDVRLTEAALADVRSVLADPSTPPEARELLTVVANPSLRIVVRIFTTSAPVVHRVWATPRDAVLGTPDRDTVELAALEPALIPFVLAQRVGLRRRPAPPGRTPVRLPPPGAGGPVPPQLAVLVQRRRLTWRARAAWRDGTGAPVTRALHVTDTGPAGLWRLHVEENDLVLEPTDARAVWRALTELLPGVRR